MSALAVILALLILAAFAGTLAAILRRLEPPRYHR